MMRSYWREVERKYVGVNQLKANGKRDEFQRNNRIGFYVALSSVGSALENAKNPG